MEFNYQHGERDCIIAKKKKKKLQRLFLNHFAFNNENSNHKNICQCKTCSYPLLLKAGEGIIYLPGSTHR